VSVASGNGIAVWQPDIRRRCLERRPPCYGRLPQAHEAMNKRADCTNAQRLFHVPYKFLASYSKTSAKVFLTLLSGF